MIVKTACSLFIIFSLLIGCASQQSVDDDRNENLLRKKIMNSYPSNVSNANINISSFNGDLLITGQVPTQELATLASDQANSLRNVREVFNHLQVMGETSFLSRANDRLITNRIKSKLQDSEFFKLRRLHIVTEYGVVYLMGTLGREELERALELIKRTSGVQKTVSIVRPIK